MTAEELEQRINTIIENQQRINERLDAMELPPIDPPGGSSEPPAGSPPDDKGGFNDWLTDLLGGGENNAE